MDIIRDTRPKKNRKLIVWIGAAVLAIPLAVVTANALPSAAPGVDRATVWVDTVEQGTMIRTVGAPGTLVPEQARWITAVTNGRIERIHVLPGAEVEPGTVLMEMSNPDVQMQLLDAQTQLSAAQSQLTQLRSTLQTQRLTQEAQVTTLRTELRDAERVHEANRSLHELNPDAVARAELERSEEVAQELTHRFALAEGQLDILVNSEQEQLDAQLNQVRRLEEQVAFNRDRLASLTVTTPVGGVLAPLGVALQEGQWVQSGQNLGRVVVPGRLKAELRIPQTQTAEITVGQTARIDTRSDTIEGRVTRIDPAVRNGTITIDVVLPESLPASARPDLSVQGEVVIERLDDVVHVGRPQAAQAGQTSTVFRMTDGGEYAERVQVRFGAASVQDMEVTEGLRPGDVVILTRIERAEGHDRIRIR